MIKIQEIQWTRLAAEAIAIVGSILLAFAIDAWWEDVKKARQQENLVVALQQDFETTKLRLETSIEYADSLVDRTNSYFEGIASDDAVSIESLRHYGGGAFYKIDFEPTLSTYESAVATGILGLIENQRLQDSITVFNMARDSYELHNRITADIHYLGPVWEVRKKLGSLSVLFDDLESAAISGQLTEQEYRRLYADPVVTGAIEAASSANENIVDSLRTMHAAAVNILHELERTQ